MSTTPYCCEHSWREARQAAWKSAQAKSQCLCDPHVEYCNQCFPPEFRPGGAWDQYKPSAPQPPAGDGQELVNRHGRIPVGTRVRFDVENPGQWIGPRTGLLRHDGTEFFIEAEGHRITIGKGYDAYPNTVRSVEAQPPAVVEALRLFDEALAAELPRVSHVEYDSHEICKHFAGELRKKIAALGGDRG